MTGNHAFHRSRTRFDFAQASRKTSEHELHGLQRGLVDGR